MPGRLHLLNSANQDREFTMSFSMMVHNMASTRLVAQGMDMLPIKVSGIQLCIQGLSGMCIVNMFMVNSHCAKENANFDFDYGVV